MPKIDIDVVEKSAKTAYPPAYARATMGRVKQRLGDAAGLTQFGVNLTTLAPGAASAHRHWHAVEDEFVFVIAGELTLIEDGGETLMRAGDAAGFKGGAPVGHHLVNRSAAPAVYLEIGARVDADLVTYTDPAIDMVARKSAGGPWMMTRRNGAPFDDAT